MRGMDKSWRADEPLLPDKSAQQSQYTRSGAYLSNSERAAQAQLLGGVSGAIQPQACVLAEDCGPWTEYAAHACVAHSKDHPSEPDKVCQVRVIEVDYHFQNTQVLDTPDQTLLERCNTFGFV